MRLSAGFLQAGVESERTTLTSQRGRNHGRCKKEGIIMAKAYMIGAGIGNLSAAVYLIRDGKWDGSDITIMGLEDHGANDGGTVKDFENEFVVSSINNAHGYVNRGGRMLNEETYENLWDVFAGIESLNSPGKSVTEEILDFDHAHPTHDVGRLIDSLNGVRNRGDSNDYSHMQFNTLDRLLLTKLMMMPESQERSLNDVSIEQWFASSPHIFTTNFWYMWETTFAFKRNSSAMELRRYMNRMILEFSRINTLAGVTRTPFNQYESLILPLRAWLKRHGVHFVGNRMVTEFVFKDSQLRDEIVVTALKYRTVGPRRSDADDEGSHGTIEVAPEDLVFDTNGSITDSTSLGDLDTPIVEDMNYAPSAALWKQAAEHFYDLGHPDKFFGDRSQSEWTSFTVTTDSHLLISDISQITQQHPGNALNTFVDSPELLSLVVHHQPHYRSQKENEGVLWGYALYPRAVGRYVHKPFIEMTGREMLAESLGFLSAADTRTEGIKDHHDRILDSVVNVVPAHMPYASALFNQRSVGDRPLVVPRHSRNLAFVSEFAEMPFDMVFTEQYSIRCAQIAVYRFLGIPSSRLTPLHHYEKDPRVMLRAARTMFR
ncbi:oleate hydratase [Bifidobacterium sp.]|uniref:oleate hydratase n=1 Tax=Bifidobacterium sp. TaxID=41200 RepID=UPI0039EC86D2